MTGPEVDGMEIKMALYLPRDAVHHCPSRADAETASAQAHAAQMRAAGKFGGAILNDPGLHIHPHD